MVAKTPKKNPLALLRPGPEYPVEWEVVDEADAEPAPATDGLGLTLADRQALGLSPPAPGSLGAEAGEDAAKVLARALR